MNTTTTDRGAQTIADIRARARRHPTIVLTALILTFIGALAVRVLLGTYTVTLPDFITILNGGTIDGARGARYIVMEDKLPRAVLGTLAGLAFGTAGAIFQLILRNPLASPDIIGISTGASLGAVIAIVFLGATGATVSITAALTALAIAAIIMLLSAGDTGAGNRFILMGIGISALAGSIITYLMSRISTGNAQTAALWMTGSLSNANWDRVSTLSLTLAALFPLLILIHTHLHATAVGDEIAHGIGVRTHLIRWTSISLGVLLAAAATAATGPIAFVAFVSGPIARRLLGGKHSLTASALTGAIIVVLADFAGANLIPGGNLPVGILTGALGAPLLIWLLVRSQKDTSAA